MPPTPASRISEPHTSQPKGEAWERWLKVWHTVFYFSLVLSTVLALTSENLLYPAWLVLGLSLFQGIWYALLLLWLIRKLQGKWQVSVSLVYLAGAMAVWFPLSRVSWAYYLVAASFYGLMWGTLPFGLAVAGNILLTGLIIWSQALNLGKPIIFTVDFFIVGGIMIGWSALLALWIRSVIRESTERKRLIAQLEAAQLNLAAAERQAGILQERQRLAQEIHDTLAQGFTSIIMQLEAADLALSEEEQAVRLRLGQARETARLSLAEARRLVQALRPEPLEGASLPEAMARVAERWKQESGIPVDFSVTGTPYALLPEVEVILLRALQEGLANVTKHAQARRATATLSYMDDQIALDVQDDGIGFDTELLSRSPDQDGSGYGLQSMRQRVAQFGGQVIVESAPGQGTTLAVQIPVEVKG